MQVTLLKSKIHRATVTGASLDYEGSLAISGDLAELVGLFPMRKFSLPTSATGNGSRLT
jgi:aspartate 1-decarboxylase